MADWYEKCTLGSLPDAMALKLPDREALVFEARRYTFAEVAAAVNRAAKALMALGVRQGDHVCLWLNNCDDWIFIMYGLAKIGAVQVPVNTRFRTRDLAYVLHQSDSVMLITHDVCGPVDYLDMVRQVVKLPGDGVEVSDSEYPKLKRVVIVADDAHPGTTAWQTALQAGAAVSDAALRQRAEAVDCDAPALIMYTSGTTGFPKGVVHTHNLVRNVEERAYRLGITPRDVILNYLPLFHAFGYSEGALTSMLTGAKQVVTPTFDAPACLDLIEREGVTIMHGFETHMKDLCDAQERRPRNLRTLRTGLFAAGMHSATPDLPPRRPSAGAVQGPLRLRHDRGVDRRRPRRPGRLTTRSVSNPPATRRPATTCASSIPTPAPCSARTCPASCRCAVTASCSAITTSPKRRPPATPRTAGSRPATPLTGATTATCVFWGVTRTCSRWAGRTSIRWRWKGCFWSIPTSSQVAVVGCPRRPAHRGAGRLCTAGGRDTGWKPTRLSTIAAASWRAFKLPRHVVFVDDFPMTASGKIRKTELRDQALKLLGGSET